MKGIFALSFIFFFLINAFLIVYLRVKFSHIVDFQRNNFPEKWKESGYPGDDQKDFSRNKLGGVMMSWLSSPPDWARSNENIYNLCLHLKKIMLASLYLMFVLMINFCLLAAF